MASDNLVPNAYGDLTELGWFGGSWHAPDQDHNFLQVNDPVGNPDDGATCVGSRIGDLHRDLYNLPAHSGSGAIEKITVHYRCWGLVNPQCYACAAIKTGGVLHEAGCTQFADEDVIYDLTNDWVNNPETSAAWTWADIDALQAGVSLHQADLKSDYYGAICTQVYVEVICESMPPPPGGASYGYIIG